MPNSAKALPALRSRVRATLSLFGTFKASPAWLFFGAWLVRFLETAQNLQFLDELRGGVRVSAADFMGEWGWLIGILWLAAVVIWASVRPDAREQERKMGYLKDSILNSMRNFEALTKAYEDGAPVNGDRVRIARDEYLSSLAGVIREALESLPGDSREEYRRMLVSVTTGFLASRTSFPVTLFSSVTSPIMPVNRALGLEKKESD